MRVASFRATVLLLAAGSQLSGTFRSLPEVTPGSVGGTANDQDRGIVIGFEDYHELDDVPFAEADAEAMYQW